MTQRSETIENYLKAIYRLHQREESSEAYVSTSALADSLGTSSAAVTDALKRLAGDKYQLVSYRPYHGVQLLEKGEREALRIIRRHRLWEVFLVEKLGFSWDSVHAVAEQLEHVDSLELERRLDNFLGNPKFDPHGDPIPDESGEIQRRPLEPLTEVAVGTQAKITAVTSDATAFLQHLDRLGLRIGTQIHVLERFSFDQSLQLRVGDQMLVVSVNVAARLLVGG